MTNFWMGNEGTCFLKGVPGDATNLPRLPDSTIVDFLRTIPHARSGFNTIYPTLLPEERLRLDQLAVAAQYMQPDYQRVEDNVQHKWNTQRVVSRGPGPAPVGGRG